MENLVKCLYVLANRFSSSTADVLTAISEFAYQTLDKNGKARDVALDIS